MGFIEKNSISEKKNWIERRLSKKLKEFSKNYQCEKAKEEHILEITRVNQSAFIDSSFEMNFSDILKRNGKILSRNSNSFAYLKKKKGKRIVAMASIFPMEKDAVLKYIHGNLRDVDIKDYHVISDYVIENRAQEKRNFTWFFLH